MESFEYCSLLWVVGFFFCHNQLFFNENFQSLFLEVEDFFFGRFFWYMSICWCFNYFGFLTDSIINWICAVVDFSLIIPIQLLHDSFISILTPTWLMDLLTCGIEQLIISSHIYILPFNRMAFRMFFRTLVWGNEIILLKNSKKASLNKKFPENFKKFWRNIFQIETSLFILCEL